MTILKGHDVGKVRALPVGVARPCEPEAVRDDPRIADLTAQLHDAQAVLAAFREQAVIEIAAAREEGAEDASRAEDDRVAAIEQGVADALAAWRDRLAGLERLAAQLAGAALAKLFDDHADLADLVGRTVAKRVRAIDAAAVVRARVSAADFGDADALHTLAARCGLPATAIVAEPDAPPGACEIDLSVGHIDLSIQGQWHAIEQCLAAIVAEDCP
jgi:flagellar assembly protein FliH